MKKLFRVIRTSSINHLSTVIEGSFSKEDALTVCFEDIKNIEKTYDKDYTFVYHQPLEELKFVGAYLSTKKSTVPAEITELSRDKDRGPFNARTSPPREEILLYFIEEFEKPYTLYINDEHTATFLTVEDAINKITELAKENKQDTLTVITKEANGKHSEGENEKPLLTFTAKTSLFLVESSVTYYKIYKK